MIANLARIKKKGAKVRGWISKEGIEFDTGFTAIDYWNHFAQLSPSSTVFPYLCCHEASCPSRVFELQG